MKKKLSLFIVYVLIAAMTAAVVGALVSCTKKEYSYNASYNYSTVESGVATEYVLSVDEQKFTFMMDVKAANESSYTGTFSYKNGYLILTSAEKGTQYVKVDGSTFVFFTPEAATAECVHEWDGGTVYAGDCQNNSYTIYTCTKCGKTKIVMGSLGSHVYDISVHTDGDCKNYGYTTYTCSVCGTTSKVYDKVYGDHKYVDNSTVVDGGCLSECYTRSICSVCGAEKKTLLGYYGSHSYDKDGCCALCGYCDNGFSTKHIDADGNGLCDACGYSTTVLNLMKTQGFAKAGDIIYCGCYPQTYCSDVTADVLKSNGVYDKTTGYYRYKGESYALYCVSGASSLTFEDGTAVKSGTTYVFIVEPVAWRILKSENGVYTLVSNAVLDKTLYLAATDIKTENGEYYNKTASENYANGWENSAIRAYLNGDFYKKTFSTLGASLVQASSLDNKTTSKQQNVYTNAQFATSDKIYLPSYADLAAGIDDKSFGALKLTDYALARGARGIKVSGKAQNNAYYLTRSAATASDTIYSVSPVPKLSESTLALCENYGFAPMMIIKQS